MPSLYYQIEAPGVNILKMVTDEVVGGFLAELKLTEKFKDSVYTMSSFMASSQYGDTQGDITLVKNRCDIEVNYIMDKAQVPWPVETPYTTTAYGVRASDKGSHVPILIDDKAGILIEHHTVACALDMNFVLTFASFDDACKAFDAIQNRYKGTLVQTPYDISFSYPVSMGMLQFIGAVYKAKTDYQNKTIVDYINDMKKAQISFDVRKSQLTDPNADTELMVRCLELNCAAQLTMDQKEPDVTRVNNLPSSYSISFNMVVQFGRPNLVAIHTPIAVDNTLLPGALFQTIVANYHYNPAATGVYEDLLINEYMKRGYGNYSTASQILRLPVYDDWFCVDNLYVAYEYRPFLIAHFTLDGPVTSFNLNDLDITLHPVTKAILSQMAGQVFSYGGIFNIGVYANGLRLSDNLVTMDSDLNITVTSNCPDKVYHLMISETTSLKKMTKDWDQLLIQYRYFFPLTIERNLKTLIDKKYFYIAYDDSFLNLINKLLKSGQLKAILASLVSLGEDTNEIYSYTQNASQLADYLASTPSKRSDYVLPTGTDSFSQLVRDYYSTKASIEGRSLLVAFIEQCLLGGYLTLDNVPSQYIQPNPSVYPYLTAEGGYYGINTPLRVINYTIEPQQRT